MKKIIFAALMLSSTIASAHGYGGHHHGGYGYGWVAPVVVGGAIGYVIGYNDAKDGK